MYKEGFEWYVSCAHMTTMRRVHFRFDEVKATQVAAFLVRRSGGKMSHLALVKLLYIIDREALARWGRPVIGGSYYSLPHGTVISEVLNLMKKIEGWDDASFWTEHLTKFGNEMHLQKPTDDSELSIAETNLIGEVFETYGNLSKWDLRDLTHQFGEWTDPKGSSIPIGIEEILHHVGKSSQEIAALVGELRELEEVDQLIGV
jgi:uncharacterized phage-associated protein